MFCAILALEVMDLIKGRNPSVFSALREIKLQTGRVILGVIERLMLKVSKPHHRDPVKYLESFAARKIQFYPQMQHPKKICLLSAHY